MTKYYFSSILSKSDGIHTAEARDSQGGFLGVVGELTEEEALLELKRIVLDMLVEYAEDGVHPLSFLSQKKGRHSFELTMTDLFPILLRYKRITHKFSQAAVARKMGIKQQVYARLEKPGKANPTMTTIDNLSVVFKEDFLVFA